MRRTLIGLAGVGLLASAGTAQATGGILGISGGVNLWYHDADGEIFSQDVDDDLGLDSDSDAHLWLQWDHVVPGIPSIRLERTGLEQSGDGDNAIDLSHTDLTLFWSPLPLPYVDIDIGLTGRYFDGEINTDPGFDEESLSGVLPMGYGRVGLDIPGTRFRFEGSIQTLPLGDHEIRDVRMQAIYKWWYAGATVGYRDFSIELDDFSDITLDTDFSGPYAGAFLRF